MKSELHVAQLFVRGKESFVQDIFREIETA